MAKIEPLCQYCASIEFNYKLLNDAEPVWSLGPWSRLEQSRCPFCKLVRRFFHEWQRVDATGRAEQYRERLDISLQWFGKRSKHLDATGRGYFGFELANAGQQICFAARTMPHRATSSPRFLRRSASPEFDVGMLTSWLTTCSTEHSTSCNISASGRPAAFTQAFPGLPALRFIDVQHNCLAETREICQYVALSYVWGTTVKLRLTKAILPTLLQGGQLENVFKQLPRTVRDAIILVRKLGLRYLWVDALCLVQDDKEDVAAGIAVMDQLYERSWFTIIAACGHDADAGLPGVRETSRKEYDPCVEVKPGMLLGVRTQVKYLMESSVHGTRAWTFQETILPRRSLYFVDDQIFFRCRQSEFSEACLDHPTPYFDDDTFTNLITPFTSMDISLKALSRILNAYTRRALTNQEDAIHAMAGILRRFSEKLRCSFFQGMPTAAFDSAVLFSGAVNSTPLRRRLNFPSYSWAGWIGTLESLCDGPGSRTGNPNLAWNKWLCDSTWIVWYKRSSSGVLNLVWDPAANESFPIDDPSFIGYRKRQPFRPPAALTRRGISTTRTAPTEHFKHEMPTLDYHLLQFWTLAIWFNLDFINPFMTTAGLVDSPGVQCGTVTLDAFGEMPFYNSKGPFEVILLSHYDDDEYNVMLLEWNGNVAERRGTGEVQKTGVEHGFPPGPVWKEIFLG
ncbi:heterokaryon incompatibility protein-domain-containing protein [Immersiella caudata]|uniref:Heterokaryon incompatibility protein-domain-containing protein n=1 Tax=Immersiella caudata TaxID=314043 RepID=A0AA39WSH2_9PEZI|nr:heterokaryon incompatibility protein-domain-containing protein [Immersiella caudata]